MPEQPESGKLLEKVVDLATGEIQEIAAHVGTIDTCLRGDAEGKTLGLIARMTAMERACRLNHGDERDRAQQQQIQIDTNRMEFRPQVVWTVDKVITAIATGVALLAGSFGALSSTCNSREIRRDNRRWQRAVETVPPDTAGP